MGMSRMGKGRREGERGYFLLQALFLSAFLSIATFGVLILANAIRSESSAARQTEAVFLAQSALERICAGEAAGSYQVEENAMQFSITTLTVDANARKEVVAVVRWTERGREKEIVLKREVVSHEKK